MLKPINDITVRKKNGCLEVFQPKKIIIAINKSAERVNVKFTPTQEEQIINFVKKCIVENDLKEVVIDQMHNFVEMALHTINPDVERTYKEYRDYKKNFVHIMDDVLKASLEVRYKADHDNANTDSALVATKRSLIYQKLNRETYQAMFLKKDEVTDIKNGFYYIHDLGSRLDTMNCCLFDYVNVMKDGFEMSHVWYTEPKTIRTAISCLSDLVLNCSAQQYGGFTLAEIDKGLAPYVEKSYYKYWKKYHADLYDSKPDLSEAETAKIEKCVMRDIQDDLNQGIQSIEYKFNTVGSSRGDFPFITFTFGLGTSRFEKMVTKTLLRVRMTGQGKDGHKVPVLFPKLVFLFDETLHGENGELSDLFDDAIKCSSKCLYPDYLSLTGDGYVGDIYKKYGVPISPMGCRAFLSPWYKHSDGTEGWKPYDDGKDEFIAVGRFNCGAISLNMPMIAQEAIVENRDFFENLEMYMQKIREIHKRTYDYLARTKASTNPVAYCQGGFHNGYLKPDDCIEPLLKSSTFSFGITALAETQYLFTNTKLVEDQCFAEKIMDFIIDKLNQWKEEDNILYAIYGTPAESLAGLQVKQFVKKYGKIAGVSDREYMTNSFHIPVWEDITPEEKQLKEYSLFHKHNGVFCSHSYVSSYANLVNCSESLKPKQLQRDLKR